MSLLERPNKVVTTVDTYFIAFISKENQKPNLMPNNLKWASQQGLHVLNWDGDNYEYSQALHTGHWIKSNI